MTAPSTLNLSHGNGRPMKLLSVITPTRMEMAGAMENSALEKMVFRTVAAAMPICWARRDALTRKKTDCAMTNTTMMAERR